MHRALEEALRFVAPNGEKEETEALQLCKSSITLPNVDNERWLSLPRKYTRNSTRFTLPIRTSDLETLTPLQYVSQHIWISDHRKQLYQYVFNKYVHDPNIVMRNDKFADKAIAHCDTPPLADGQGEMGPPQERIMDIKHLNQALTLALGFHGTAEKIEKIREILYLNDDDIGSLNFRSWCGVVAFAERYLNELPIDEDSIDEVTNSYYHSIYMYFLFFILSLSRWRLPILNR